MLATPQKQTPGGNRASAEESAKQAPIIAEAKRFATARARAALVKNTLIRVSDGYMLARGTYSRHCADLATVEAMLDRMGAPA